MIDTAIKNAVNFVIDTKFSNLINHQVRKASITAYKYQLTLMDISVSHTDAEIADMISNISYEEIHNSLTTKYRSILDTKDYKQILALFNEKGLSKSVGHFFGCTDNNYCDLIIRFSNGEMITEIRDALKSYLPQEIPFTVEEVAADA